MKKVIIPDDLITIMVSEAKLRLLAKGLKYLTPKKEEEQDYNELTDILETLIVDEY